MDYDQLLSHVSSELDAAETSKIVLGFNNVAKMILNWCDNNKASKNQLSYLFKLFHDREKAHHPEKFDRLSAYYYQYNLTNHVKVDFELGITIPKTSLVKECIDELYPDNPAISFAADYKAMMDKKKAK